MRRGSPILFCRGLLAGAARIVAAVDLARAFAAENPGPIAQIQEWFRRITFLAPPLGEHVSDDAFLRVRRHVHLF
jgi:hypothetical protein